MKHYAGLDLSIKETSVCIVDEAGKLCHELKVPTHPEDLVRALKDPAWQIVRIGLEAGPLSQWVFEGLAMADLPAICIETRHTKAFLKAQVNKSDRNDARGIAQMMRVKPNMIVSDHGTEFTSNAILAWSNDHRVERLHCAGQAHAKRLRRILQWPNA